MAQLILGLMELVSTVINAYSMLLVIYALLTWFPNARSSGLFRIIGRLVEPYLNIFHRLIPPIGMISFSILFAILFLRLVERGAHIVLLFLLRLVVG